MACGWVSHASKPIRLGPLMHLITIGLTSNKQNSWPANEREADTVVKILLVWFPEAPSIALYTCLGKKI